KLADARHADARTVLAPAHAADRLATVAQLIGLVVGVEGKRHGAACAVFPAPGPVELAGAHLVDQLFPMRVGPLPGLQLLRGMDVGHDDLLKSSAELFKRAAIRSPAGSGR